MNQIKVGLILITCLFFQDATVAQNITGITKGTYQSLCVVYDMTPSVILVVNADNTFSYVLPYVQDKIEGTWIINKDSLVLQSGYFLRESPPDTPIRKHTDLPNGRDVYLIKGQKLFPVMKAGIDHKCYLTRYTKTSDHSLQKRKRADKQLHTGDTVSVIFGRYRADKDRYNLTLLDYKSLAFLGRPTNCLIQGLVKKKTKDGGSSILTIEVTTTNNCDSTYFHEKPMVKGQEFSYNMTYFNLKTTSK